jgi:hypothetical protein
MTLGLDFAGRLKKIQAPPTRSLQSVFEAVANSFDSTEGLSNQGRITVRILREEEPSLFESEETKYTLKGYEVEDNGVGFGERNMKCFRQSDTTNKVAGKGVGRLLWLKVFNSAHISSTYTEDGKWWSRDFAFSVAKEGVDDAELIPKPLEAGSNRTIVRLLGPEKERIGHLVQDATALAARLLEHFLLYFAVFGGPKVVVIAEGDEVAVDVASLYEDLIGERHKHEDIEVQGRTFSIHHLFVKPTTRKNLVKFCARQRVVLTEKISALVPEVGVYRAVTVQHNYRYHAYVTGDYLDDITDDERSDLKFPKSSDGPDDDEPDEPLLAEEDEVQEEGVSREELFANLATRIRAHLREHIADVRKKKEKQLEDFVHKEQPQFRPFVETAKRNLERLPARPSKRDIEVALYLAKIDERSDLEKTLDEIVKKVASSEQVGQQRQHLIEKFATDANRQALSALAEYVCTRKAVIDVLKANLGRTPEDKYRYEDIIHDLFFPRHRTSDEMPVGPLGPDEREIENLWLIDERLVFHRLLTSDKPLSVLKKLLVNGKAIVADITEKNDEPDILIFDPAFVTTESDNFSSLGIIEFKRPGRQDYSLTENPVQQIIDIAKKIRRGHQIETTSGQVQAISTDVRIYGYAVCDILGPLRDIIVDTFRMRPTPDGIGYYTFHEPLNLSIELIPYSKIVSDAERRNAAFFKKLGM